MWYQFKRNICHKEELLQGFKKEKIKRMSLQSIFKTMDTQRDCKKIENIFLNVYCNLFANKNTENIVTF